MNGYHESVDQLADDLIEPEQALRSQAAKARSRVAREETLAAADELAATRRRLRAACARAAEAVPARSGDNRLLRPLRDVVEVGALRIDPGTRQVLVDGEPVALAKMEFELLRALASEPRRVFTKDELLRGVWGFRSQGRTRTLDSHASRLRGKLNGAPHRHYVVNAWGVGYSLVEASGEIGEVSG